MSNLVPSDQIEDIVGRPRHATQHIGRAVSAESKFYILHSQECLDSGIDLRACAFSKALDKGIDGVWPLDGPFALDIVSGHLRIG